MTIEQKARELAQRICLPFPNATVEQWILSALRDVRREALRQAWHMARDGCLVPPDGGSPTEDEVALCNHIADGINALIDAPSAPRPDADVTRALAIPSIHDLTIIYENAEQAARMNDPGGHLAGNPTRWPSTQAIIAVRNAMLTAIAETPDADVTRALRRALLNCADELRRSEKQFAFYAQHHLAKEPPDGDKAQTNNQHANRCGDAYRKAISALAEMPDNALRF